MAQQAALDALRLESGFLQRRSHAIRTPLHGVLGTAGLLLETELDAGQRQYVELIRASARMLLATLEDVLDFSRLEADRLILAEQPFDLRALVGDTLQMFELRLPETGLELEAAMSTALPERVIGDAQRLQQVLANLLDNALKHTEQGRIQLRIAPVEGQVAGRQRFAFSVTDSGAGMSPEEQASLFDGFVQVDQSGRYGEGAGMGLALSARIVELMGGRLEVESEPGKGSEFRFEADFDEAPAGSHSTNPESLDILLAEDNPVNSLLASRMLETQGHRVVLARNGQEVLRAVAKQRFDLVLMDVQMPEMDGLEASAAIRRDEAQGTSRIPIVALTAEAVEEARERCLAAGMDAVLSKPIEPDALRAAVRRHVAIARP